MNTITTAATAYTPPNTAILHNTTASLTDRSPTAPVHLVQYDQTVPVIAVSLTENDSQYTVPSGAAVNVRMDKPDGKHVYDPALGVSEDGKTVYIGVTAQMTAAWGRSNPIVEIVIDGGIVGTAAFPVMIDQNPVPDSAYESTDEYLTLYEILQQAQNAAQIVQQNAQNLQNLTDNLEAVQNAAANAQAAAASAAAAQQAAQEALGFRTFFGAVTPDENGDLDPSRPMTTPTAASVMVKSKGDRIQSVQVNGFTTQAGAGDPSPANVRAITVAAQDGTLPITLTGGQTVTESLKLTAPMCAGDKVESCVPSGCDKSIVFDGSSDETWIAYSGAPGVFYTNIDAQVSSQNFTAYMRTRTRVTNEIGISANNFFVQFPSGKLRVAICIGGSSTDPEDCKAALQTNPEKLFYRSTAYTEANDISVQLEAHSFGVYAMTGAEDIKREESSAGRVYFNLASKNAANQSTSIICSQAKGGPSLKEGNIQIASNIVYVWFSGYGLDKTVDEIKEYIAAQHSAGTPVTIVYKLATPAVYARDPVTLVAVPYTQADVDAANKLANTPSTLPAIDSPDVPMLLDEAGTAQEETSAQPMSLAAPLASALPVAGTYIVSSQEGTTVAVSLKAFQDGGTPSVQALLNLVYPVGSIYMSATNVSPQVFLGGTWQQIQGQFLLAASSSYPAGSTGGEAEHTLTNEELPEYTNGQVYSGNTNTNNVSSWLSVPDGTDMAYGALSLGGGQAHNNMPPYPAVYMWQRTA